MPGGMGGMGGGFPHGFSADDFSSGGGGDGDDPYADMPDLD